MYSPEAYIWELKQLFRMTTQKLSRAKLFTQLCHFACDILFCTSETCNSTTTLAASSNSCKFLKRLLKNSLHECWHNNSLDYTKQQLTLPLRVRGFFFLIDNLFCFQMNSRACAKKISQPFATGRGRGHVHWVPVHVRRISREKKKMGRSPRHHVHSRISPASTHTPLTEYFPFGSPTKLQLLHINK